MMKINVIETISTLMYQPTKKENSKIKPEKENIRKIEKVEKSNHSHFDKKG